MPRTVPSTNRDNDPLAEQEKKDQRRLKNEEFVGEPGLPSTGGDASVSDSSEEIFHENKK